MKTGKKTQNAGEVRVNRGQIRELSVFLRPNSTETREETLRGEDYVVTPAVILVEGVLQGAAAEGPELALFEEFAKIPAAWNGRPVVAGHPRRDNNFVSAGSPDVWGQETIGWVFNAIGEDSKLKCELWLNKAWMESSGYTEIKANVESSEVMEVSTGLFTDLEQASGVWNGEKFDYIWRNVVPDHLAILEGVVGACSVEDGCGTARVNYTQHQPSEESEMPQKCTCSANKDAAPGDTATNTATGESAPIPSVNAVPPKKVAPSRLLSNILKLFQSGGENPRNEDVQFHLSNNVAGLSTTDLHAAVYAALTTVEEYYFYMQTIYDDSVVYEAYRDGNYVTVQRMFSITADGAINMASDTSIVRPVTSYVPVNVTTNAGTNTGIADTTDTTDTTPSTNEGESAASTTTTGEESATVTSSGSAGEQSGEQVDTGSAGEGGESTAATAASEPTPPPTVQQKMSLQHFLENGETMDVARVNEAITVLNQTRSTLIKNISQSSKNSFTVQELNQMSTTQLEKLSALAQGVDYSLQSGPQTNTGYAAGGTVVPMQAFPRKQ